MARPMRRTSEMRDAIIQDFIKHLDSTKTSDGKLSYSKTLSYPAGKEATIIYSEKAWFKTIMLVETQKLEVGWYGICRRAEDDDTTFYIDDILVYPQAVTGATINPDDVKFAAWEDSLDDETFNNLRFHGHSHVNMGVFSSGTDEDFRMRRLSQLEENEFFVFQVFNKRGEIHSAIYDSRNNIFYENKDITTLVVCDDMKVWEKHKRIAKLLGEISAEDIVATAALCQATGIHGFLKNADNLVEEERRTYGNYQRGQGYSPGQGWYDGTAWRGNSSYAPPAQLPSSNTGGAKAPTKGKSGIGSGTPPTSTSSVHTDDLQHFTPEQQEILRDPFGYMDDLGSCYYD